MPAVITSNEYLKVNGIILAQHAWHATDLSGLYDMPLYRGDDRQIPYKPGRQSLPRISDVLNALIPVDVNGELDGDDTPHSDPAMGVVENMDTLKAAFAPPSSPPGTYPIVWVLPDGSERFADGLVLPPLSPESLDRWNMAITLNLYIPSGFFTESS